jgi:hypothetical protein
VPNTTAQTAEPIGSVSAAIVSVPLLVPAEAPKTQLTPEVPVPAAGGDSPADGVPMSASKMSLLRSFVQDAPPPPLERAAGVHRGNS